LERDAGILSWFGMVELSGLLISKVVYHREFSGSKPPSATEMRDLTQLKTGFLNGRFSLRQTLQALFFEALGHDGRSKYWAWGNEAKRFSVELPEYETSLCPDLAFLGENTRAPLFLVWSTDSEKGLDAIPDKKGRWKASPQHQFETLLERLRCPLGLLTDGRSYRLFFRQVGNAPASITWDRETWFEEPASFEAFRNLLSPRALLPDKEKGLFKWIRDSQESQAELTSELANQVFEVVGLLLDAVNENPQPVYNERMYEVLVKIAMRIVFVLFAEENRLLPHGIPEYDNAYGLIHLANFLDRCARELGEEQFAQDYAYRYDAWAQLRSLFYLIYAGSAHPRLVMVAHGGDLFDPKKTEDVERVLMVDSVRIRQILRRLLYIRTSKGAYRLSYASIRIQQIGYVYEGLLEHSLVFQDGRYAFSESKLRKSSGTYYTPKALTEWLVENTLAPLCYADGEDDQRRVRSPEELLSLKVVDPAMGSGAFLVEAMDFLSQALLESWDKAGRYTEVEEETRANLARRQIAEHCLYGVDLNPMAVELAKMSLWLSTFSKDKPFSFLNHRLKCGNSLVGTGYDEYDLSVIPDKAMKPVREDSAEWKALLKSANAQNRKFFGKTADGVQKGMFGFSQNLISETQKSISALARTLRKIEISGEQTEDYFAKERVYAEEVLGSDDYRLQKMRRDLWLSRWFLKEEDELPPLTNDTLQQLYERIRKPSAEREPLQEKHLEAAKRRAVENRFFHWEIEFPEVFETGGFDAVLGNPPWDMMLLNEREFFADKSADIHETTKTDERERKIRALKESDPALWAQYRDRLRTIEQTNAYLYDRKRFESVAQGTPNTYAFFAGLFLILKKPSGRAGILCPTGIATDDSYAGFFKGVVERGELESLSDFVNGRIFEQVDSRYRFSLLVFGKSERVRTRFLLRDPQELFSKDPVSFSQADLSMLNPNTGTLPVFHSGRDVELLLKVYRRNPVLQRREGNSILENPYGIQVFTQFHMSNDSKHFVRAQELEKAGYRRVGGHYVGDASGRSKRYAPLMEGKSFSILDARFNHVTPEGKGISCAEDEKQSPDFFPESRYYVAAETVEADYAKREIETPLLIGFRDVTNATNERTMIATLVPRVAFGHKAPIIHFKGEYGWLLLPILVSHPLDYFARNKMQGVSMGYYILYQLPVIPPERFEQRGPDGYATVREYLTAQLITCLKDNAAFEPLLRSLGYAGPVGGWDERERIAAMARIDAVIAHLYGLNADDLEYLFTTFPIEKKRIEARYGAYLCRDLALEAFHQFGS